MSLLALVHQKAPELRFVEYFKSSPLSSFEWATLPIVKMTRSQFQDRGLAFVQEHFRRFKKRIVGEKRDSDFFKSDEEKRLLKQHVPVFMCLHHETKRLEIIPCKFQRYNLGGFSELDRELFPRASLSLRCSSASFLRSFDAVAAEAG